MDTKEVNADIKGVAISPRKTGLVASLVRGRKVDEALSILEHTPRHAARQLMKAINSAKANAENNHNIDPSSLDIVELTVGPGQRMKRYRPAAHGRALPYSKLSSNIHVSLKGKLRGERKKSSSIAKTASRKTAGKDRKAAESQQKREQA